MGPQPDDNGNDEEVVAKPKQRQRTMALKKARKANGGSSSLVDEPSTAATTMPPPPPYQDSEGQQQQGGKRQRLVWTDHLHAVFVEAYDSLGEETQIERISASIPEDLINARFLHLRPLCILVPIKHKNHQLRALCIIPFLGKHASQVMKSLNHREGVGMISYSRHHQILFGAATFRSKSSECHL
ncbi:hypothetical protein U9M48_019991 [Paspalum notatum var. saurae]|uniref:Uncharacterized protein n=1 Tax=Paspalum notatum var. saurae TaxID=547442 RepID=A0AAQ3TDU9_PASNO